MPELYVIQNGRTIDQRTLSNEGVTIGRAVDVSLQLDSSLVSRRHAQIAFENGNFAVQDLQSGNGVFVNGVREYHRVLKPNDKIEIGGFILLFAPTTSEIIPPRGAAAPPPPPPPVAAAPSLDSGAANMGVGSGATMNIDSAELARLMREKRDQLEARFVVTMERGSKTYPLKKNRYTVGYHRDCDLRLPGDEGKKLFTLSKNANNVEIKAIGWFAKVEINGERRKKSVLHHGDEINARGAIITFKAAGKP